MRGNISHVEFMKEFWMLRKDRLGKCYQFCRTGNRSLLGRLLEQSVKGNIETKGLCRNRGKRLFHRKHELDLYGV